MDNSINLNSTEFPAALQGDGRAGVISENRCIQSIRGGYLLSIFERNGSVHIRWSTCETAGKHDFIALYKGPVPINPTNSSNKVWHKYKIGRFGVCDTGIPWAANWSAGYCGRSGNPDQGYRYYVHTGLTRPGAAQQMRVSLTSH